MSSREAACPRCRKRLLPTDHEHVLTVVFEMATIRKNGEVLEEMEVQEYPTEVCCECYAADEDDLRRYTLRSALKCSAVVGEEPR